MKPIPGEIVAGRRRCRIVPAVPALEQGRPACILAGYKPALHQYTFMTIRSKCRYTDIRMRRSSRNADIPICICDDRVAAQLHHYRFMMIGFFKWVMDVRFAM